MGLALGRDEHRLARAVGLEDLGAERAHEGVAVARHQPFGAADDVRVGPVSAASVVHPAGEEREGLRVGDDRVRSHAGDERRGVAHRRLVLLHGVHVDLAAQRAVEVDLPPGDPFRDHGAGSPVVERRHSHAIARPSVAAQAHGLAPRLALVAVLEAQGDSAGPARPLGDVLAAMGGVDEIVEALLDDLAGEDGERGEVRHRPDLARVEAARPEELSPVGHVSAGML